MKRYIFVTQDARRMYAQHRRYRDGEWILDRVDDFRSLYIALRLLEIKISSGVYIVLLIVPRSKYLM